MDLDKVFENGRFLGLFRLLARNSLFTSNVARYVRERAYESMVVNDPQNRPLQVRQDKYDLLTALLECFLRVHRSKRLAPNVVDRLISSFVNNVVLAPSHPFDSPTRQEAPFTIAISPTQLCNLQCRNCYAVSDSGKEIALEFDVFDRVLDEKARLWGSHFTVVSGGEPFVYRSEGRTILDAAERHPDQTFMVYTNGTLITPEVAERMAALGNISPAISVEGYEAETDARRGKGVYKRIMRAMENLRAAGVAFGTSVTVTRANWDLVSSREFVEHFFLDQGIAYMWIFQYMPIGRAQTLDLMVQPDDRKTLMERTWDFVRNDKFFIVDFWNSGTATNGCMAGGRPGGYLHINWRGDILPCVFTPYTTDNIHDVYARGQNLVDVLDSPFFKYIRRWQDAYGYSSHMDKPDNWLAPCIIRDHFKSFAASAHLAHARPTDGEAAIALEDEAFAEGLAAYGRDYRRVTDPLWQRQYLRANAPDAEHLVSAGD